MQKILRQTADIAGCGGLLDSIIQHLVLILTKFPKRKVTKANFELINEIVQQILLQKDTGEDPDISPLALNVAKSLTHHLAQADVGRTRWLLCHVSQCLRCVDPPHPLMC